MSVLIDARVERFVRGEHQILQDVHWRAKVGEHWAVLGANGSGKSTLLKIVAGYEWPSKGTVSVLGQTYGRCYMPDIKKRIGLANAALYEWFPAKQHAQDVVASGLHATIGGWQRFSKDDLNRASHALTRIRADQCAAKPYGVLSQGEKQRVMIARALVREPELLILDEPCAGLDPGARESFLSDVDTLCEAGPSLAIVTHHVEEIPACVTHALVLKEGKTLAQGPIQSVVTSAILSRAFDANCDVTCTDRRFSLRTSQRMPASRNK